METTAAALRLYDHLTDPARLSEALAPDVVLHVPGSQPLSGEHRGRDAVLDFLVASAGAGEGTELLDVMGGRQYATAYCRVRAERDGARLDNHTVHLLRIEDGRVAEAWFHNRDQAHVDAFWSAVLPASAGAP